MTIPMRRFLPTVALAWMLACQPAWGHEVWIDRVILVQFGDPGEKLDPYKPEKITSVTAFTTSGENAPVKTLSIGDTGVVIAPEAGDPATVMVQWDSGYRIKQGEKWVPATEAEAKAAGAFRHGSFSSKAIFAWGERFTKPLGNAIELVPQADPLSLKPGDTLTLVVMADGKPVAGAEMPSDDKTVQGPRSDAEGKLSVVIAASGTQVVKAKVTEAEGSGERTRYAVLSFRVAGK